jgi:hypothetical protein
MSTTFDNQKQRFEAAPWKPKEQRGTKMNNAPSDPPVVRLETPEHFATEDSTARYVPKSVQGKYATSNIPRFSMPPNLYGPARSHFIVASTTSANTVDRQRSYAMLRRMSADGDEMAAIALTALDGLIIE